MQLQWFINDELAANDQHGMPCKLTVTQDTPNEHRVLLGNLLLGFIHLQEGKPVNYRTVCSYPQIDCDATLFNVMTYLQQQTR